MAFGRLSKSNRIDSPIGEIKSFLRTTAPYGYLFCDGTVYNIADYPLLAQLFADEFGAKNKYGGDGVTTFAVPDFRGEFFRCTGTNSHTDGGNGSTVGTHQGSTVLPHYNASWSNNAVNMSVRVSGDAVSGDSNPMSAVDFSVTGTNNVRYGLSAGASQGTSQSKAYAYGIRPTNTSLLVCIRAY